MIKNRPVFHKSTLNQDPEAESWLDSRDPGDDAQVKDYIIHHKRSIEEMIFWEDKVGWLRNYLTVRKEFIDRSIAKNIKRDFAYLDVIDSLLGRAVAEDSMQVRAWLMEYKNSLFDEEFIDSAESDLIDYEFELRDPFPAEYRKPGRLFRMGKYPCGQDGRSEDLTWQVLDIIEDRALAISCNVICFMPYNKEWGSITWDRSSIRKWLNDSFLMEAFAEDEREQIALSRIRNQDNQLFDTDAGPDTMDRIFLLSIDEAREYFEDDEGRKAAATPFAAAETVYPADETSVSWRLRSPGYKGGCYNACVNSLGMIDSHGCFNDQEGTGIRPAMWIRL